jgi:hypothetical protein
MTSEERIRRFKLQLEALKSWPPGEITEIMTKWVLKQIARTARNERFRQYFAEHPETRLETQ